jgi:DNA repair protein RecO (recombination protein O)
VRRGGIQTVEAIVLRKIDYGESDQIIGLLTHPFGKISAFASGAKKSVKRFGAGLDLFSLVLAQLRPPNKLESHLWRLNSIELIDFHMGIRDSLERFATASYLSDCLWNLTAEGESNEPLFHWWKESLLKLSDGTHPFEMDLTFDLDLLKLCGYSPSFEKCIECGKSPQGVKHFFSFAKGGISCEGCQKRGEGRWWDATYTHKLATHQRMSETENRIVQKTIDAFFSYTLGKELKSLHFRNEVLRVL